MNQLSFKSSEFGTIRTTVKNGEPWFIATDVCRALDISNGRDAVSRLEDDEKGVALTDTPGGTQKMTAINESGLYSLVLSSRKPEAKAFKRWVTHEILPSIRKRGMYATPEAVEAMLADPDTMIQTLKALKEERQLRELAESTIEKQKPLVTFAETCLASKDSILVRELAKIINNQGIPTGEHKLYAWMREKGLLMRGNEPYQRYIQSGYFVVEQKPFDTPYGTKMIRTTRVTPRGQAYIIKRLTGIEGEKNHG